MLKGILFVVFIIVTFDIGVSLIEYFDEDSEMESVENAKPSRGSDTLESSRRSVGNSNPEETAEAGSLSEYEGESKTGLNLSLPENIKFESDENDESELENAESAPESTSKKLLKIEFEQKKKKSSGLKAKPILDFEQGMDKPQMDGASIEWKKEL